MNISRVYARRLSSRYEIISPMREILINGIVLVGHHVYALEEVNDAAVSVADALVFIGDPEESVPYEVPLSTKRYLALNFYGFEHEYPKSPLLALEGKLTPDSDDIRLYQRDRLGRRAEAGALLELMPLPCSKIGDWPYSEIFPQYPTREEYLAQLLDARIDALRKHLAYGPSLVVAYGSSYWSHYRRLFPATTKWRRSGPFEVADVERTRVILTPHFTAPTMNGHREELIALATHR